MKNKDALKGGKRISSLMLRRVSLASYAFCDRAGRNESPTPRSNSRVGGGGVDVPDQLGTVILLCHKWALGTGGRISCFSCFLVVHLFSTFSCLHIFRCNVSVSNFCGSFVYLSMGLNTVPWKRIGAWRLRSALSRPYCKPLYPPVKICRFCVCMLLNNLYNVTSKNLFVSWLTAYVKNELLVYSLLLLPLASFRGFPGCKDWLFMLDSIQTGSRSWLWAGIPAFVSRDRIFHHYVQTSFRRT